MFDKDSSGDIDTSELRQVLRQLGMPTDSSLIQDLLKKYDHDGNGDLGFAEFEKLVGEISAQLKAKQEMRPKASAVQRLGTDSEECLAFLKQIHELREQVKRPSVSSL